MKHVMYHYNGVQGEEELHDDEVMDKLTEGQVIERGGEYWKIIEMHTMVVATDPERVDVVNVFLEGPKP
jgi:hypothetical protein